MLRLVQLKYVLMVGVLFTLILPFKVLAANEPFNMTVSPLPINITVKPGGTHTADLRVKNSGSTTQRVNVRLLHVKMDDNGQVTLTKATSADEYTKWVSFSRTSFDAPAGEWQTIKMTVSPPKDAAFGYYFAVEYENAQSVTPGKNAVKGAIATFILLNVDAPGAKREANLASWQADNKVYEFLPANFAAKIRSTGNVHAVPYGNVFILNSRGKQVDVLNINEVQGAVLPQAGRIFNTSWNKGFPHYEDKPKKHLVWDWSKLGDLRFGQYTAKLQMIYDDGQRDVPIEGVVKFWVIPWRIIGAVTLALLIIGFGFYSSFRGAWRGRPRRR